MAKEVVPKLNAPQNVSATDVPAASPTHAQCQADQPSSLHSQSGQLNSTVEQHIESVRNTDDGHPLSSDIRQPIEKAVNADFRTVRIHINREADALTRMLRVKAFTIGHDIFFRNGEFQPGLQSGLELLIHELVHIL